MTAADGTDHDHAAVLEFEYATPDRANVVAGSVHPEVDEIEGDRSHATIDRDGATLAVEVTATDLIGLRAGLTTWLGLVAAAERTARAARGP